MTIRGGKSIARRSMRLGKRSINKIMRKKPISKRISMDKSKTGRTGGTSSKFDLLSSVMDMNIAMLTRRRNVNREKKEEEKKRKLRMKPVWS